MSKLITITRPYAKAAFNFAVEQNKIKHWESMLVFSAEVSRNKQITDMFSGAVSPEKMAETFIAVCGKQLDTFGQNLIRVMAENKRLAILPNVLEQFLLLEREKKSTIEIKIVSAQRLTAEQLAKISTAMEKQLSRKVTLTCEIDTTIIAGIIIRAGDMVIDGSIQSRLERLAVVLNS
ncbi:F0F1 ATP synthase subunit delta [Candidatus Steffania adelgidicola]|uniref:F0F1 ATP synthase subunit delta n=1 Tax=Candidatus Steffania adelgidicola TaxID=1076626 RepID=UPI001D032FAC|nr:F0F1 ATP synthase subunit delta [Candidatus Steffania adelgidicola]UDG80235.1 ATP synthase subunit delta [Candidatus Steffania adelgidicola]